MALEVFGHVSPLDEQEKTSLISITCMLQQAAEKAWYASPFDMVISNSYLFFAKSPHIDNLIKECAELEFLWCTKKKKQLSLMENIFSHIFDARQFEQSDKKVEF